MSPERIEIQRWLSKARRDWRMAELAMGQEPPFTDAAAFHCQQTVEKALKAYLLYQEHELEKMHDLRALVMECAEYDPAFAELAPIVDPLTPYAVRFRYPGPGDPTSEQINQSLEVVRDVWAFVLDRLPEETRP